MSAPTDRKYLKSHEWHKSEGGEVVIGITQNAADELTDITYVSLPKVGTKLTAGARFGEIESVKATLLYLPPYSPDLNPIEPAFSKLKQLLRSAGHRTREALWNHMQPLLNRVTPSDAAGFFRHCGYTLQVD